MGQQRLIDRRPVLLRQTGGILGGHRFEPHDDPGGAEAALASTGGAERLSPALLPVSVEAFHGGDLTAPDPPGRGHTGHPGLAVDQHRATPALALWATAVLYRNEAQSLPQDGQQGLPDVGDLDLLTVHRQAEFGPVGPRALRWWLFRL